MKKLAIGLLALIVLLVVAVVVIPQLIDWNDYKPEIAQAVRDATGRELMINGDIDISILPDLSFQISDVTLSNAANAHEPQMLKLDNVRGRLRLFPLLWREVILEELIVSKPTLHLEVDAKGQSNWAFDRKAETGLPPAEPSKQERGLPVAELHLGDVRLENGLISFDDARTGQTILAKAIKFTAALDNLASALALDASLEVNNEPVTLVVTLDSLRGLSDGQTASLVASLKAPRIDVGYNGKLQQTPVPVLDGNFDLSIPSVGKLAAWLDRPLASDQPDPGPLKVQAIFEGAGAKVTLKKATIEGAALQAQASGVFDASGKTRHITFDLKAKTLDLDRYLPPPAAAPVASQKTENVARNGRRDIFAAIPDQAFDLAPLRNTEAQVSIAIDGIKARGYEIGNVGISARAKDGVLSAELSELRLYGGNVAGSLELDGTQDALAINTALTIDKVDVGALARAAQGETARVVGIAAGKLEARGRGTSPRTLAQDLVAKATLSLSGIDVKNTPGVISKLDVVVDLPGAAEKPSVQGNVVYNEEAVTFTLNLDPLPKVLSGERFAAELAANSERFTLSYDGAVQTEPAPALDGTLNVNVPSVGRLASWLGQPLEPKQPDPGPLKVKAVMSAEGPKMAVKEASIDGKALHATATGSVDASTEITRFDVIVNVIDADLNAYLPPNEKGKAKKKPKPAATVEPAGWSEEPIDLSALRHLEGRGVVKIGHVRYGELDIENGTATVTAKNGELQAIVEQLALADGTVSLNANVNAAEPVPTMTYQVKVTGVEARPVLKTFAATDRLSGTMELEADGQTRGVNQKQLIGALNGQGRVVLKDGAIHGINVAATLRKAKSLGLEQAGEEKTDFAELSGTFTITNGIVENRDLKMLAPLVRLTGGGTVPMPPRTINYKAEAKLVASLEGQGGQDALAGLPIPINVEGSWDQPNVSVDWKSVLAAAAQDPKRLANMPNELRNLGKDLGIKLPIPGGATGTGAPLGDVLKVIPALPGTQQPKQEGQQEEQPEQPKAPDAIEGLKKLFGN